VGLRVDEPAQREVSDSRTEAGGEVKSGIGGTFERGVVGP